MLAHSISMAGHLSKEKTSIGLRNTSTGLPCIINISTVVLNSRDLQGNAWLP